MGEYYRGVIKGGTRSLEFLGLLSRYKPVPPRVPKRALGLWACSVVFWAVSWIMGPRVVVQDIFHQRSGDCIKAHVDDRGIVGSAYIGFFSDP